MELSDVIKIIKQEYQQSKNKNEVILLGASCFVTFKKPKLWNLLVSKTGAFKSKKVFDVYFGRLLKRNLIVKNTKTREPFYHLAPAGEKLVIGAPWIQLQTLTDLQKIVCIKDEPQEILDQTQTQPLTTSEKIEAMCDHLKTTLIFKNQQYGSSSLEPIGIFELPRTAKIQARLEDKITRLSQVSRSNDIPALQDTLLDLAGYSILYLVLLEDEQ